MIFINLLLKHMKYPIDRVFESLFNVSGLINYL